MASAAYRRWLSAGKPWKKARPVADVEAWADDHGVRVLGTIGDQRHLIASRPKDHTPFSHTAWPLPLPGWIVCAIDLVDDGDLAGHILQAARAGALPWLKYANLGGRHYKQGDGFRRSTASDDEHIHLSVRTDHIDTEVSDGWLSGEARPWRPAERPPAPGPDIAFPLPDDHWFGRDDSSNESHSGRHGRRTAGKLDATWIKTWTTQLGKRGWSVGKGKTYLTRWGADGQFGDEHAELVHAFQEDQGLEHDELLGPITWNQAFDAPIT